MSYNYFESDISFGGKLVPGNIFIGSLLLKYKVAVVCMGNYFETERGVRKTSRFRTFPPNGMKIGNFGCPIF